VVPALDRIENVSDKNGHTLTTVVNYQHRKMQMFCENRKIVAVEKKWCKTEKRYCCVANKDTVVIIDLNGNLSN
jgi:hypothetical protein